MVLVVRLSEARNNKCERKFSKVYSDKTPKKTLGFLQHNLQNGSPDSFELVNDKCDKPEQDFFFLLC